MCEVDASAEATLEVLDAEVLAGFGITKLDSVSQGVSHPS